MGWFWSSAPSPSQQAPVLAAAHQQPLQAAESLPRPLATLSPALQTKTTSSPQSAPNDPLRRSARQLGLFFAGAGFLAVSALISRRAVSRRMIESYPKFYQPGYIGPKPRPRAPEEKGEDQLVAVEALGLATLNVLSFGVMMTGGMMFAFDISSADELRGRARKKLDEANGVVDKDEEQQVEQWITDMLSRKESTEGAQAADSKKA